MFNINQGKGFQMKFDNGYELSVQFGVHNYCERHSHNPDHFYTNDQYHELYSSNDAEVAVFNPYDNFVQLSDYDAVVGHVTPDELARFIPLVASGDVTAMKQFFRNEEE